MTIRCLILLTLLTPWLGAASDGIQETLANRVDQKKAVGIVVATIDANGRNVVSFGKIAKDRAEIPDANTVFEIGSVTKAFTSLLLADMVERGEVRLDTPVADLLPKTVKVPSRNGRQITLLDLSTQSSGLPRLPANLRPADLANPYADYSAARLYEFLSGYTLPRDPGEKYEYSNLGAGLLGHALALKAGMSYEELVRKRILEPLGMHSTSIALTDDQKKRLAPGYNAALNPAKNWDFDALAGCGALRSTANDMLRFLSANLELTDTPLKAALRRMRSVRKPTGVPDLDIAMAWHVFTKFGGEIIWHNGGTGGYRSFVGFDPAAKKGVVILCNTFMDNDDLGLHILDSRYPVARFSAAREHVQIAVDPEVFKRYEGEYQLAPAFTIKVTRDGNRLLAQATNQPAFEIFAEKENEFFYKVVDAQITFVVDSAGRTTHLVLHQNGQDMKAVRIK
ncbi:MAG: serine hydrolase [Bryobacteraceae bacterium]|jgi:CubicO group peptidase (beta-lactamase class C family)